MDFRSSLLLVFACVAAVGCRKDPYVDAYFDMLNAEKRGLEDRIYELEYNYEVALKDLEECRAKLAANGEGGAAAAKKGTGTKTKPSQAESAEEPDLLPKIELPPGFNSSPGKAPDTGKAPASSPPARSTQVEPAAPVVLAAAEMPVSAEDGDDAAASQVTHIFLNPRLTGGQDFDGQPGDDGLSVLVEPRDSRGQFVSRPGKVSIVVLDPAETGDSARIARWDFEADVAAKLLRASSLDRGLHFRMPWPDRPPTHDRLHVFVRYWCPDGRQLEAERQLTIRLPSQTVESWTPRPDRAAPAPPAGTSSTATPAATSRGRFWKPER